MGGYGPQKSEPISRAKNTAILKRPLSWPRELKERRSIYSK